mmetsp:Transcript_42422/g.106023  ORF Transcript_42422/g.106023 Transcript_42422/m.106023 type:complete len:373 (+) Transcript_42422:157-1275(+)|eukprot:CAMPEP_0173432248 /NCGR_PEP_ID=MMETSP1357-20121228/10111_1 /TAXON_ID=77926 /ORGANISM="Hemiselmis rufescens, Strain PCC563" /LENGTH=372 /DNA_ID=CAMNT_0014396819 /DNA_START=138 /DNA_END=1256 /DNA_ORIENTATION=+
MSEALGRDGDVVLSVDEHNTLVEAAFVARGFSQEEAEAASRIACSATWHGNRTHNALKALHIDELFGSQAGGCTPGAEIRRVGEGRFKAVHRWDAQKKMGQWVAYKAMDECMRLASEYGVGVVTVDNAFHYLWGGGYALYAAERGFIAYTQCTSTLAEVVPFQGSVPTLGTNPHTWAFPTQDAIGFPVLVDWATSTVAMGRIQQLQRDGKQIPPGVAVDAEGKETLDPSKVSALMPFGAHKGYGLSLVDELYAAYGGGSLPTCRGRTSSGAEGEKYTCNLFFQCFCPEAVSGGSFAAGRTQDENVKAVLGDIMGHGNSPPTGRAILPGQMEADAARFSEKAGGLVFSPAEAKELEQVAAKLGVKINPRPLKS